MSVLVSRSVVGDGALCHGGCERMMDPLAVDDARHDRAIWTYDTSLNDVGCTGMLVACQGEPTALQTGWRFGPTAVWSTGDSVATTQPKGKIPCPLKA